MQFAKMWKTKREKVCESTSSLFDSTKQVQGLHSTIKHNQHAYKIFIFTFNTAHFSVNTAQSVNIAR